MWSVDPWFLPSTDWCPVFSDLQTQSKSPEDKMLYRRRDTDGCKIYLSHRSLLAHRSACQPSRRKLSLYTSQVVKLAKNLASPHGAWYQIICQQQKRLTESIYMDWVVVSYVGRAGRDLCSSLRRACIIGWMWIIFLDIKDNHCACELMRDRRYRGFRAWMRNILSLLLGVIHEAAASKNK